LDVSEFLQFIGLRLVDSAPRSAYASERITVLFAAIVLVSSMECRRSAFGGMEYSNIPNRHSHSRCGIGFLKAIEIILRGAATSLFDVQRWTFDVRRSSFKKP